MGMELHFATVSTAGESSDGTMSHNDASTPKVAIRARSCLALKATCTAEWRIICTSQMNECTAKEYTLPDYQP
jgi:hypothetical protein